MENYLMNYRNALGAKLDLFGDYKIKETLEDS